jgi:hypothetical protein
MNQASITHDYKPEDVISYEIKQVWPADGWYFYGDEGLEPLAGWALVTVDLRGEDGNSYQLTVGMGMVVYDDNQGTVRPLELMPELMKDFGGYRHKTELKRR